MDDPSDNWEALFNHNFLRWFHLSGSDATVEIVKVVPNVELTLPGGAKSIKPVLYYKQIKGKIEQADHEEKKIANGKSTTVIVNGYRPLVLNVTNGNSIAEAHGGKWKTWAGKRVVFFQDETTMWDKDTRKMVTKPCVRIRAVAPAAEPLKKEPEPVNHEAEITVLLVALDNVYDQAGLDALSGEVKRLWPLIDTPSKSSITKKSNEIKARIAAKPASAEPAVDLFAKYTADIATLTNREQLTKALDSAEKQHRAGTLTQAELDGLTEQISAKLAGVST